MENKICGVVVLYNPILDVIDNIRSYVDQIELLFVVDNSDEKIDQKILDEVNRMNNTVYISNGGNIGIAAALNIGVKKGIEKDFNYILTMDQDSNAPADMIKNMFFIVEKNGYKHKEIGIITPFFLDKSKQQIPFHDIDECSEVITSGNLLNLESIQEVGGFWEELFIDRVDHEICLRLRAKGYKILKVNKVILDHNLGNITNHMFFGKPQAATNHSPIRRYYIIRNTLYVSDKYKNIFPQYGKEQRRYFFYDTVKIILFEKQRWKKIKAIVVGYFDYKNHRIGKFDTIHKKNL